MYPSISGPGVSPGRMTFHRDTADFRAVSGPGEDGSRRTQIGRLQVPLLWRRRIGLLLLAVVVLPWLSIFGSVDGPILARRARGVGERSDFGF